MALENRAVRGDTAWLKVKKLHASITYCSIRLLFIGPDACRVQLSTAFKTGSAADICSAFGPE